MRIIKIFSIFVFCLLLSLALLQRDTTVYAPGFTETKFRTIRVGMKREDVIRILGDPIQIDPAPGYIYWSYPTRGRGDHPSFPGGPTAPPSEITFHADLQGKIQAVYGDHLALGLKPGEMVGRSLDEVKKRFGEPTVLTAPDRDLYWYTKCSNSKGDYIRFIVVNDDGLVGSVEAGRVGHYIEIDGKRPSPSSIIEWLEWNL
jgi:hypothetical protein